MGAARFVPRRLSRLTDDLADRPWSDGHQGRDFHAFAALVSALYHHEFHLREGALLDAWADLIPDDESDDVDDSPGEGADRTDESAQHLTSELTGLLDGANYEMLTMAELDDALARESLIPLRLEVDLDDYDEVVIARRNSHTETVEVPRWRGLRKAERTITVDDRVVVHTRVKPRSWFDDNGIDPADRNLVPGHVSLKQFQNVPRADIEMLLPSTQVKFRRIDSLIVGIPAVASGIAVLATKLLPTLGLIFLLVGAWLGLREESPELDQAALVILLGGAITLGGFVFRQWNKLKNRRVRYLKTLSENLYFRTLADGPGVLHTLYASAEQQEVMEVLLAYRFLLDAPDGLTATELDAVVEAWLAETCRTAVDFEVDDALVKLGRLQVIDGRTNVRAVPLPEALERLDRRWDDLFHHRRRPGGDDHEPLVDLDDGEQVAVDDRPVAGRLIALRRVVDRFTGRLDRRRLRREDEPSADVDPGAEQLGQGPMVDEAQVLDGAGHRHVEVP
ncbi:MAG: TMEM143 family protein [Actinomycetota bacterium]